MLADIGRRAKGGGLILGRASETEQGQNIPLDVIRTTFSYSRDRAKLERLGQANGPRARAGFEPVDCGALSSARYLEPLALLVAELAYRLGARPELGLRFLRGTVVITSEARGDNAIAVLRSDPSSTLAPRADIRRPQRQSREPSPFRRTTQHPSARSHRAVRR